MKSKKINSVNMNVLSTEKIQSIHNAALTILEEVGVTVNDKETLDILDGKGVIIEDDNLVKIPSYIVENALKTAPKDITIYDRTGKPYMNLNNENIYFGIVPENLKYLDPYTGDLVDCQSEQMEAMCKVGDYLPNIDYFTTAGGLLSDYDEKLACRMSFYKSLLGTTKPINFISNGVRNCEDIIEMASIVAGGKDNLKEKPFIFEYSEPIPPLTHGKDSCQTLLLCAEAGVPIVYMPYCMMGGTSPITFAGTLAQTFAEILSGLVISQAKEVGAPFIIGNMPTTIDMKTTIGTYGTPEFHLLVAASSEIAEYYGIPFYGTAGVTDSKKLDNQMAIEFTMNTMTSILSKANLVHDLGLIGHATFITPEGVVLENEILNMLQVIKNGVEVNEEKLALHVIKDVGPGGNYLQHKHTYTHFKEMWYSELLDRTKDKDVPILNEKINAKTKEIIENHKCEPLPDEILKDVEKLKEKWEKDFYNNK